MSLSKDDEAEEAKADIEVWRYVFGFSDIAVVRCAVELGIADAIYENQQPMTLSQLSSALGCNPSLLFRIMRFLVQRRFFGQQNRSSEASQTAYTLTPISRRFLKHGFRSMADLLLFQTDPFALAPWHALSACVRGEATHAFAAAFGDDVWGLLAGRADKRMLIDNAMACDSRMVVPIIVRSCPEIFDGLDSVVDVGGGNGTSMRALVEACPWIKAINFDLPEVVSAAPDCMTGVSHVAGDMFSSVPNADAVFIKWVLHDWEDKECVQILKKCIEAIPKDKGKVIIVEAVITEDVEEVGVKDVKLMLDMLMMAHSKGRERTEIEWKNILIEAGFSRYTIKPIPAIQSVIEAYP